MKIHRLDHIHVYCLDPEASLRFYTDVFEAGMLGKAYGSDGGVRYFLRLGGLALVLAPYPKSTEPAVPTVYRDGIYEHDRDRLPSRATIAPVDEAIEWGPKQYRPVLRLLRTGAARRFHGPLDPLSPSSSRLL